jgi:hypothetical protein
VVEAESDEQVRALGEADPAVASRLARFEICPMPVTRAVSSAFRPTGSDPADAVADRRAPGAPFASQARS